MKRLVCHDCGKRYDFDVDDFCPRCGSFTPPKNRWGFDASGNMIRVDGIDERNHAGSFVHREAHREKAVRKQKGLDRDQLPTAPKFNSMMGKPILGPGGKLQSKSPIPVDAILERAKPFLPPSLKF